MVRKAPWGCQNHVGKVPEESKLVRPTLNPKLVRPTRWRLSVRHAREVAEEIVIFILILVEARGNHSAVSESSHEIRGMCVRVRVRARECVCEREGGE